MSGYLLDTNHLSAYLDRHPTLEQKVDGCLRSGGRVGICLPVLCEYRAGIRISRKYQKNLSRLQAALNIFRLWPVGQETAEEFANIFRELRTAGKMMSQFDLLIAAVARQYGLTVLTADRDFAVVSNLEVENWL
jgi:predicted nucleic acid-binding protein